MDLSPLPRSLSKLAKLFRSKKSSSSADPSSPVKEGKRGREEEGETSGWRRAKSKGGRDEDEVSNVNDRSSAKIRPSPSKKKGATRGSDGEKPERAAAGEGQEKRTSSGRKTEMVHSPSPAPEVTPTKTETSGSARKEHEMAREGEEEKGEKSKGDDESIMSLPSEKPIPPNEDIMAGEKLSPTTPVTSGAEVSQRQGEGGVDMNGGENAATRPSRSPLSSSTSGPGGSNNKESKSIGVKDEEGGHEGGEKKLGMMSSPPSESDKEEIERMREEQEQGDKRSYSELAPTTMISSSPLPTIGNEEMRARSGVEVSERQGGGEDMNGGRSAVITSSPSPSLVSTSVQGGSNNELERIRTGDERARHESGEQMMETTLAKREILESDKEEEEERTREEQEKGGGTNYSEELSPTTTISSSPLPTVANEEMRARSGVEVSERQGGEGEAMYGVRSTEITSPLSPSLLSTSVSVGGNYKEPKSIQTREEQGEDESEEKNVGMTSSHPMTETTSTKTEILETAEEDSKGTREEQGQRSKRSHPIKDSPTSSSWSMPMSVNGKTELGDQKWSPTTRPTIANEDVTATEPKRSHESFVGGGNDEEPESINARGGQGEYMNGKKKMEMVPIPSPILETTPSKRKVSGNEEIESTMEGQVEGDETSNQERRDDDRNVPSTSFMFESVKEETRVEKPKRKEEERQRGAYNGWKAGLAFGIIAVVGTITWIGSTLFLKRRQSNVQSQRPRQP